MVVVIISKGTNNLILSSFIFRKYNKCVIVNFRLFGYSWFLGAAGILEVLLFLALAGSFNPAGQSLTLNWPNLSKDTVKIQRNPLRQKNEYIHNFCLLTFVNSSTSNSPSPLISKALNILCARDAKVKYIHKQYIHVINIVNLLNYISNKEW